MVPRKHVCQSAADNRRANRLVLVWECATVDAAVDGEFVAVAAALMMVQ